VSVKLLYETQDRSYPNLDDELRGDYLGPWPARPCRSYSHAGRVAGIAPLCRLGAQGRFLFFARNRIVPWAAGSTAWNEDRGTLIAEARL